VTFVATMNPYREWYLAMHEFLALADTVGGS